VHTIGLIEGCQQSHRIEKQWEEPRLYVEDSREAALASLQVAEAKMWQLQQEATELERSLTRERRRGRRKVEKLEQVLTRERQESGRSAGGSTGSQGSRASRLLGKLNRIRNR
jgi:hypothetical protein